MHRLRRILGVCGVLVLFLTAASVRAQPGPEPPGRGRMTEADARRAAKWLQVAFDGELSDEAAEMLIAIVRGTLSGSGDGWFHPGQSRFDWKWLAEKHGIPPKEGIAKEKFLGSELLYSRLDRNKDGRITADDLDWSDRNPYVQQASLVTRLFRRMDPQGDGRVTSEELLAFFNRAAAGKDHLTADDLRDALLAGVGGGFLPGDAPKMDVLVRGVFNGEVGSRFEGPRLNQRAPDFRLKTHDGSRTVKLSEMIGSKPVVLVFGNFTCGPFRALYPTVDDMARRYKDEAVFLGVYVREAHPTDGWRMESNDKLGVSIRQPATYDERASVATKCFTALKYSMPLLVDGIDDPVGHAYSGMPSRIYVLDREGKVAYKGGRGPFGFKPGEAEQALAMLLLERQKAPATAPPSAGSRFTSLNNDEAWQRLPRPTPPLPAWARILSASLPRTTAGMLQLDRLHRADNPLGPVLAGKLRWAAADTIGCDYARRYAEVDLRRAGLTDDDLKRLTDGGRGLPKAERVALAFARKLTRAAHTVTDAETAELLEHFGPERVVAMVHTLAFANFQDRIFLALRVEVEPDGPLPPLDVQLDPSKPSSVPAPVRPPWEGVVKAIDVPRADVRLDWKKDADLEKLLEQQKARKSRIALPPQERLTNLPPEAKDQAERIVWSNVSMGYQPRLTRAWFDCMALFPQEAKMDRVFSGSVFWVVTRSNECFY